MRNTGAYPRRCGGTRQRRSRVSRRAGLSPQVRGNQRDFFRRRLRIGPIPAGAGEPDHDRYRDGIERAYPRRCGGTVKAIFGYDLSVGLSPQVRGNLSRFGVGFAADGPIPAGAGEPRVGSTPRASYRAYPRRCGGTFYQFNANAFEPGLSPQVRGNRRRADHPWARLGPIPAGAGEPAWDDDENNPFRAYPRRCGGTVAVKVISVVGAGLSPQVRGNRRVSTPSMRRMGPIPAGAGEPPKGKTLVLLDIRCQRAREALICTSVSGRVRRTSNAVS